MEMPHAAQAIAPFVDLKIPPVMGVMGVMSALVAAFVFGIGISALNLAKLRELSDEGCAIIGLVLGRALIPALPYYIACVFGILAAQGTVFETFQAFGLVLATAITTQWLWLAALFLMAALMSGSGPRRMMRTMLPAYFTAVGTMSSAASMPVTLRQTKELGVTEEVANFTVPLCSTIHMCGSIISIVTGATAVMFIMPGMAIPDWSSMVPFILVLGVTMVAAPGVPGGAVMAALGLLGSMLGFGETAAALMIALHMAQDSFGTACNVTGDGALSVMVDRMTSRKGESTLASQQA
jgi:Na+/H+-dicarboxylate symporter